MSSAGYESSVSSIASNEAGGDADVVQAFTDVTLTEPAKTHVAVKSYGQAKLERHVLDQDVVGNKTVTGQQLVSPSLTPDWQLIKPVHFEKVLAPENWDVDLDGFQERIGVSFKDVTLLKTALTHHGCLHHNVVPDDVPVGRLSNRSLEFLGDSLLGMAAASFLFQTKPWYQEGQLTRAKSALVNNVVLAKVARDLGLTDVQLWPPSFTSGVLPEDDKGRETIAAAAVESLIAAVYLDQGMERAMEFLASQILPHAAHYATPDAIWNPVAELQHLLLAHNRGVPVYKCLPVTDGSPAFTVELLVQDKCILKAWSSSSYSAAKTRAAEDAHARFKELFSVAA
ncbi:Ribonuclease 3 [Phytophthora cinnamomi]|uniref:Ribonuclease 3 n=1 Tax=Phytophthora cinnamomi TaxID=4785 RepID=UPI003559E34A|nr:Ribonuclease 3 [Phytophthora cinnamomi]